MSRLASVLLEQQNLLFKKKSSKIQQQKRNVWSSKMKNTANKGTEAQLDSIRARFRSWELWVMGPPCFRCATLMLVSECILISIKAVSPMPSSTLNFVRLMVTLKLQILFYCPLNQRSRSASCIIHKGRRMSGQWLKYSGVLVIA